MQGMRVQGLVRLTSLLVTGAVLAMGVACRPGDGEPAQEEPLTTEEIGGSIDAELSTEEDPRGPRWVRSEKVLPPGFPVDLPMAPGSSVAESGSSSEGDSFVVFDVPSPPAALISGWTPLLVEEGWAVRRISDTHLTASKADRVVRAIVAPLGAGSRLRLVFPVPPREQE